MSKAYQSPLRSAIGASSIAALLALSACDGEAPEVASDEETASDPVDDPLPMMGPKRTILAFGDSLFAGYSLEEDEGYPERLEAVLRGRGVNARVIDAGNSGDTTAAGRQRIGFVLDNLEATPDLAIVELGGNDLLRGLPQAETRANLDAILAELQSREIPILLMGMRAPPNLGPQLQGDFDAIYPDLAEQYDAGLVPFFMEPLFAEPGLFLPDRVHPTAEGVERLVAASVDTVVDELPEPSGN